MNLKSFSAATATGVLALGLVLGAPTAANAKVKAKDAPSKADIVKVFPELKGGTFATDKTKKVGIPAKTCGTNKLQKVKSAFTNTGVASTGTTVVTAGVFEFKSAAQAKGAIKKYKKYVKKCKSFTLSGVPVTLSKDKAPKVGQDRLAMTAVTNFGGVKGYASSVIVRHGKRIASVGASNDSKVSSKKMKKIAKVVAKKMK
ncbi:hypothetical protein [Nocardioides alcanivorans]|uniref:hypothetical protein n=1 Tax=Nocardioides alcanivorans TaxID=2897352 RepID=UPI001F2E1D45|nr:hypothetical protein [Nocardioides alcanivorans]